MTMDALFEWYIQVYNNKILQMEIYLLPSSIKLVGKLNLGGEI